MAGWPGNPIATIAVTLRYQLGGEGYSAFWTVEAEITPNPSQQIVASSEIDFTMNLSCSIVPYINPMDIPNPPDNPYYKVFLDRLNKNTGKWEQISTDYKVLSADLNGALYSSGFLTVSAVMADIAESYRFRLLHASNGDNTQAVVFAEANQGLFWVGSLTADFIPYTIVYCPPGKSSVNSITKNLSFGTRFTLGTTQTVQATAGFKFSVDILGLFSEAVGSTNSQVGANGADTAVQVSNFRAVTTSADNSKAIAPEHQNPLGDLFVLIVNPAFEISVRADNTVFYQLREIQEVITIPAWKLLRPSGDPVASQIPPETRRNLLQLDPFITNLDLFFPDDTGADLAQAVNVSADPSANNRAELIGLFWLDAGSVIVYSESQQYELKTDETNELQYSAGTSFSVGGGINYDDLKLALGIDGSNQMTIKYQSSRETTQSYSVNASCSVVIDEGNQDLRAIALYYDKVFSTFMFRRVRRRPGAGLLAWISQTRTYQGGEPGRHLHFSGTQDLVCW